MAEQAGSTTPIKAHSAGHELPSTATGYGSGTVTVTLVTSTEEVDKMIMELDEQFNILKKSTLQCLEKHRISVKRVADALTSLSRDDDENHKMFLERHVTVLYTAADNSELFGHMNSHWNYLDPSLLHHLVRELCLEEVKGEMEVYKSDLQQFRMKTPLTLFCKTQKRKRIKPSPEFREVVVEFDWSENATLEDVERFRQMYALYYNLRDFAMTLTHVRTDSVTGSSSAGPATRTYGLSTPTSRNISRNLTDERAQQLIDKAMKSGSIPQRNVVGVITGLMGSGKTTLLCHLFGLAPPDLYTSTGVAERSFRGLLHHIVQRLSAGGWKHFSYEKIREYLAPLIRAGMKEANVHALAVKLIQAANPLPQKTSNKTERGNPPSPPPLQPAHESKCCQEIAPLVKEAAEESPLEDLILELVHMIDTGGQPELMEVMPSLIHNANLAMVLVDLRYGLDECPKVNYHEEGKCYERRLSSQYTSRDIILKLVSTLQVKESCREAFRLLIVATHRDCVENDLQDRVKKLNMELWNLLIPAFKKPLILFESPQKVVYVLNLNKPDDSDKNTLSLIRSEVGKPGLGKTFDTPTSFFVFEQDLLHFARQEVKRDILSLDECKKVGAKLKMSGEMVEAALVLFHRQNTLLYFRRVLPNHVFVNPQVPLDIVNGIVHFRYKVNAGEFQSFPAEFVAQINDCTVTEEMLSYIPISVDSNEVGKKNSIISSHFKEGIYEVQDALKLYCYTFTLAPIEPETIKRNPDIEEQTVTKKQYLMMCLLPAIPEKELHRYIPESSDTVPLVVKFSNGCVPLGCFGSTISCLLSQYKWEIAKKGGLTKCLAHNIASLHDPKLRVNVVLVDFTQCLEIHIDSNLKNRKSPQNICSQVSSIIFSAISKVFKVMRLDPEKIKVSPAVFSICPETSKRCLAILEHCEGESRLCCYCCNSVSAPNEEQCLWFYLAPAPGSGPLRSVAPKLRELLKFPKFDGGFINIVQNIGDKYRTFGIFILEDDNGAITDGITTGERGQPDAINHTILTRWLQGTGRAPQTWDTLVSVLDEVGLRNLASTVRANLQ